MKAYLYEVAIALDCLVNALLGGIARETICLRAARAKRSGKRWGCVLCRLFDLVDNHHCHRVWLRWHHPTGERREP